MENKIIDDLNNNKKIVIFNYSKNECENIKKEYKQIYPEKNIIAHYSKSKDNYLFEKRDKNGDLVSINDIWNKCDILIYNICITVGIDFNIEYFDKIYIYYDTINNVRDVIQSINRVRKYKDNEINIFNKYTSKDDIYDNNIDLVEEFKNDIINNELFIKEYNEYIDINNKHNQKIKNMIDDLDFERNTQYYDKIIDNYLNINDYLKMKYDNMDDNLKNIFNRSLGENLLSSKCSLAMLYYFFNKVNYSIEFNNDGNIVFGTKDKKEIYYEIEDEYEKLFKKYYEINDNIDINKLEDKNNRDKNLYRFISDNQKKHNKKYNDILYDNIKHYIKFNETFEFIENNDYDINIIFDKYISTMNYKYFERLKNYKIGISSYDIIDKKLKKDRCIELINVNTLKYEKINNELFNLLNIDTNTINNKFSISKKNIEPIYKYIKNNINDILKIESIKKKINIKKDNYEHKIMKEFLSYYNIDVSYEDKHGLRYDDDLILFNNKNYLNNIKLKINNNKIFI
jgi:hypothetical protein